MSINWRDVLVARGHPLQRSALFSTFASVHGWASEKNREKNSSNVFLGGMPPRENHPLVEGLDIWCCPYGVVRQTLLQLDAAGVDAPRREARKHSLEYARRLGTGEAGQCATRSGRRILKGNSRAPYRFVVRPQSVQTFEPRHALARKNENIPEAAGLTSPSFWTLSGALALTRLVISRGLTLKEYSVGPCSKKTIVTRNSHTCNAGPQSLFAGSLGPLIDAALVKSSDGSPALPVYLQEGP